MKSGIVIRRKYLGYEVIVKRIDWSDNPHFMPCSFDVNTFWYCGYVVIPKTHPYYGVDYNDLVDLFDVHGGLTYSGELDEVGEWVLGFDCNHADDNPFCEDQYYTLEECLRLVEQIIKAQNINEGCYCLHFKESQLDVIINALRVAWNTYQKDCVDTSGIEDLENIIDELVELRNED